MMMTTKMSMMMNQTDCCLLRADGFPSAQVHRNAFQCHHDHHDCVPEPLHLRDDDVHDLLHRHRGRFHPLRSARGHDDDDDVVHSFQQAAQYAHVHGPAAHPHRSAPRLCRHRHRRALLLQGDHEDHDESYEWLPPGLHQHANENENRDEDDDHGYDLRNKARASKRRTNTGK